MTDQNRDSSPRVDVALMKRLRKAARDVQPLPTEWETYGALGRDIGGVNAPHWERREDPDDHPLGRAYYCALAELWKLCTPGNILALLDHITTLEAENARLESAWAEAEGKLSTAEHERDVAREENARLRGVVEAAVKYRASENWQKKATDPEARREFDAALSNLHTQANRDKLGGK